MKTTDLPFGFYLYEFPDKLSEIPGKLFDWNEVEFIGPYTLDEVKVARQLAGTNLMWMHRNDMTTILALSKPRLIFRETSNG